jgi:hypothetical protein
MGTSSFPGGKTAGHGAIHPTTSGAEAKERVELYLYPPWAFMACIGSLYVLLPIIRVTVLRVMRCAGNVAYVGEVKKAYKIMVRTAEGKTPLRGPRKK